MDGWMDAWMEGCMDGGMHGWMDGWMERGRERKGTRNERTQSNNALVEDGVAVALELHPEAVAQHAEVPHVDAAHVALGGPVNGEVVHVVPE